MRVPLDELAEFIHLDHIATSADDGVH